MPVEFTLVHGLYWLVANLAEEEPLVLVVDDLQWCDPESRRFLSFLVARIEELPVLLVTATRPAAWEQDDLWRQAHEVLRPHVLTESGVRTLLAERLDGSPGDEFVRACLRATGGVPFHLNARAREEVCPGDPAALAVVEQAAPDRIARLILGAAARAGSAGVLVCRALAVLDGAVPPDLVAEVAELPLQEVSRVCDDLDEAGLLARDELALAHPIVVASVLANLPRGDRERLHRRAALAMRARRDVERAAVFLLEVPPMREEWVAETLRRAAAEATRRATHEEAARLLRRARLEYGAAAPMDLDLDLAVAEVHIGAPEAAVRLADLVRRSRGTRWWPEAVRWQAQCLAYAGDLDSAADLLGDAVAEMGAQVRADLLVDQYFYQIITERTRDAADLGRTALQELEQSGARGRGVLRGALALHAVHRNEPAAGLIREATEAWQESSGESWAGALHRRADTVLALVLCGALETAALAAASAGYGEAPEPHRQRDGVARLAATGATNRDIAMQLFVTVKTVEVHLTNCYRKLGIGSRRELADALV